ncbi:apolipoprotein N-acyltransferase [Rhizobium sp. L1K21]|uniref:apolipoprotein N-acyltransferase n=1 Tax=Rhizobium sp. L1K21 TaxID=2954933 RepID=UPI00209361D4|nr:apolipoprotein N-acyltransferase [Rhizobium sp. L1K21]MCO6187422.1 apolipoprotein N-acyltransferase [Rhizobium sp. L1K21]
MEKLAGKVMLLWGGRKALLTLGAGAVGALALAPFDIFATMFVAFTLLVWIMDGTASEPDAGWFSRIWPAFLTGWLFGFGYFAAGLWWLGNALLEDGAEFAWAIPLASLGLPFVLAVFYGLATVVARLLWSNGPGRITALALGFGLAEWLRSFVLTGFPWNAIGYAAMPVPLLMQPAHILGIAGMNILAVFVFSVPALLGTRRGAVPGLLLAALLIVADLGYGFWMLGKAPDADAKEVSVRIVQPMSGLESDISDAERAALFEDLIKLGGMPPKSGDRPPQLIVWPETSIPFILSQNQSAFTRIDEMLGDGQVLVAGAVRAEDSAPGTPHRYYNSVYAFGSDGEIIGAADKVHLVPFGEYLPFEDFLKNIGLETIAANASGGYSAATRHTVLTLPGIGSVYPLICYEAIFPTEIDEEGETAADVLLNVTNDTWFGYTPGPYQHFQAARITAVEVGKPMIRAADSGISAIIDPQGRIISGAGLQTKGVVDATLRFGSVATWSKSARNINFWLLCVISLIAASFSRFSFVSDYN